MKYVTLIVLIGFVTTGAFGFTLLGHDSHTSSNCPTFLLNNVVCSSNAISVVVQHISAFLTFTQPLITYTALSLISFLASLLALFLVVLRIISPPRVHSKARISIRRINIFAPLRPRSITRWLSLFELSPSFLLGSA